MNDIFQVYMEPWRKFATFKGRATRSEYWLFGFGNIFIVLVVLAILAALFATTNHPIILLIGVIFYFGFSGLMIIPSIAVTVRRLHDTGKSGVYFFVNFIPFIGGFIHLAFMLQGSEMRWNQYDLPDPRRRRRGRSSEPEVRERTRTRKRRRPTEKARLEYADPDEERPRKRRRKRLPSEEEPPRRKNVDAQTPNALFTPRESHPTIKKRPRIIISIPVSSLRVSGAGFKMESAFLIKGSSDPN